MSPTLPSTPCDTRPRLPPFARTSSRAPRPAGVAIIGIAQASPRTRPSDADRVANQAPYAVEALRFAGFGARNGTAGPATVTTHAGIRVQSGPRPDTAYPVIKAPPARPNCSPPP